ncbi:glutamate synthase large subunit [Flaviflexus salsibiostraticola]|uniref:Glutamate synthase large subunit n=1 Tax=Flaviflexus salsibiostraticola TaxID=1282737 RepID=A0A3Q8WTP9_9ACTO|nr:glutamate synthase large subunit [Flaviflexus salsibiostraticola]AZN29736.1 glutamate synthase large subunit [Flaviflexus salsibiostraticola]
MDRSSLPQAEALFDPCFDKDACGIAMVATLRRSAGHDVVERALSALRNLEHRGAVGSDAGTGDGAGILTQVPDDLFRALCDMDLPPAGGYATGLIFLPTSTEERAASISAIEALADEEGLTVIGWRDVPIDPSHLGTQAREAMPHISQLFVSHPDGLFGVDLDRRAFRLRKRMENTVDAYPVSLSSRTITYKGMVTTLQLEPFYPDLSDPRFATRFAIVHSRFSTNTFPSWPLAQPLRMIAHNGEINTVRGNRQWMKARDSDLQSDLLGDMAPLLPTLSAALSDSGSFDEALELLTLAGRSLPHAVMMMVPQAWESATDLPRELRDFYEFHSLLMEPWDGPAAICFTDGSLVGATLDRNGLRPSRWMRTTDGLVICASETGVLPDIPPHMIEARGRLKPGEMLLIDTEKGLVLDSDQVKLEIATMENWGEWLESSRIDLADLPDREHVAHTLASVVRRQRTFGYTEEDLKVLIGPMATTGAEPVAAMGSDVPIAVLSARPRLLFDYFSQAFAQVTNPPLDSIREALVTSLRSGIGPVRNLLSATPMHASQIITNFPVLTNDELAKIKRIDRSPGSRRTVTLSLLFTGSLEERLTELFDEVDEAIEDGAHYIVLSDRDSDSLRVPVPSLLAVSAVHQHLIRTGRRMRVGLVVEAGDAREVHHIALLLGYGASAVNPYLAMESAEQLSHTGEIQVDPDTAVANLIQALGKGVLKIMSKMGISAIGSYIAAQTFEAVGLSPEVIDPYFTGTPSRLGGIGLDQIEKDARARHAFGYQAETAAHAHRRLTPGGEHQWRPDGEVHLFTPETVFKLQHATRTGQFDIFREYTQLINNQARELKTLRGLFAFKARTPISIDEVEPIESIMARFQTGAMSYGSISAEAHETLAVAMNRIGGKSNTGEGGEDLERLLDPERRSAIKQVASGRFGVTSMYLTHADDIQIKMAQGAKPGEGGQLPGKKMYPWIAATRGSTPGIGLVSPPPHHDIYSIEDLKQLIFDLKRANSRARINVKLVAQSGIGAVAAGVAKAKADVILISGFDGGTGAAPINSLGHAGIPWEIGLAEAQQTLRMNRLRGRVTLTVDGSLKTGRDVIIGALLGAEEFGFATAPLVVSGCIMMRKCHLDTCPVGVATQNPELRARFSGQPEFVETFFRFIASEVREILAELGFRTLDEAIGRADVLEVDEAIRHVKTDGLDLSPIFAVLGDGPLRRTEPQDHELDDQLDSRIEADVWSAIANEGRYEGSFSIKNTDRAIGTMLGGDLTRRHGDNGLGPGTITLHLDGSAGQSLGAFLPRGITLRLLGDANDYVGKGLSGGTITIAPHPQSPLTAHENVIAGNVIGYGATSGRMFLRGIVGERFLVRNSGATAVCEGAGDHALEYMTGGTAVILGPTGRNLGAGMSGGCAYVLDLDERLINREARSELACQQLTAADIDELSDLLTEHVNATGSGLASELLISPDWHRFTKIVPKDWALVTQVRSEARERGEDPNGAQTWAQILEVTHG